MIATTTSNISRQRSDSPRFADDRASKILTGGSIDPNAISRRCRSDTAPPWRSACSAKPNFYGW
jgi:hypothetical protein